MGRENGKLCLTGCGSRDLAAPLLRIQPSAPAKAWDPVRRGVSRNHDRSGILDHPHARVMTAEDPVGAECMHLQLGCHPTYIENSTRIQAWIMAKPPIQR